MLENAYSRRKLLGAGGTLAAGAAGLALVGCGDDEGGGGGAGGTPRRGGTIKVAFPEPIPNAIVPALNEVNYVLRYGIWEGLIRQGPDFKPELVMAETFEMKADSTGLQVKLKPGLTFHNGKPFTSEDVRRSIQYFQRPDVASQLKLPAGMIKEIKTPDARTVEMTFEGPRPFMEDTFAFMPMLDGDTVDDVATMKTLNGTGPFKFVSYTPQVGYSVVRNENYHESGRPYLDGIDVKILVDEAAMVLALQAGEVDYVHGVDPPNVKKLQADSNIRLTRWMNGGFFFVGMVVNYPPLRDVRVRQAIAFALDRKRFAAEFGEGLSEPTIQLWVKGSPGYFADQESLVTYDPERAKSLLQQAGYGSGLTIPYDVGNLAIRTSAAQFNQDDLKKVGINLDIQVSEYSAYLERFRSRRIEAAWPSNTGSTNTMHPAWTFASDQAVRIPNASHYEPADYKAFLDNIYSLDPRSPQGQEQLRAFNKRSILDEVWITGLMERVSYYAARKRLSGIDANGGRRGWPVDWWLSA